MQSNKLLFHNANYEESEIVFLGIPLDYNVSFRRGSKLAAERIREVSDSIETYSIMYDNDVEDAKINDWGDIDICCEDNKINMPLIENTIAKFLSDDKKTFSIGGDHSVAWPIMKAYAEKYDDLAILHFDAHADMREEYEGNYFSHATPMRKIADHIGYENCYSFGIRSAEKAELLHAKKMGYNMFPLEVVKPLTQVLQQLQGRNVYITFDIDVLDPAFAPGTGTLETNGCNPKEIMQALKLIHDANINVVGCDIVEVAPELETNDATSLLAANLVREFIINFFM